MPWGKMDDKFHRNRKVRGLLRVHGREGREALGCWTFWWSWCLDDPDLTGVVPGYELDEDETESARLLVDVGLWDVVDEGYRFHDFHDYNPTREQRDAKKSADRERVANKRGASREDVASDTNATDERVACESKNVASTRVPSPPIPSHPNPRESTRARLVKGFQKRWDAARKAAWPGTKGDPEWDAAAKFIEKTAEIRGVSVESLATEALDSWFADEWVIANKYPDTNFPKHIAKHIDKSPTSGVAASPELAAALEAQERAEEACRKARLYRDSVAGTEAHSEASRAHSAKQRELAMAKDRVEALSA